jgi:hypothetical protein
MASTQFDMRGLTIGLDHNETDKLLSLGTSGGATATAIAGYFTSIGIVGAAVPYVAAAIALHLLWEFAAIKASDQGHGVWLNATPPMLIGMPGVIIPSTRWEPVTFDAHANGGTMASGHGDTITWHIDRGVGAPDDCKFVLVNEMNWAKAYKLRIGGDSWWVEAAGHQTAENGAWFNQLGTTSIEFHKPGIFGIWGPAELSIANFDGLAAQDVTTFRWVKD